MKNRNHFYTILGCLIFITSTLLGQNSQEDWKVSPEANKLENPLGGALPSENAKNLFKGTCAPCHGDKGKGDGPAGIYLDPKPFNLTVKKIEGETDGSLYTRVSNGHLTMPTFKNSLTEIERWQMVTYIRYLQQQADQEKAQKNGSKK